MKLQVVGLRWYIAGLICLASGLNYLDRQTLSVLAQTIQDELHISTVQYSYITSAFLLSYTVMYVISGRMVDRLGPGRSFLYFVSAWSFASVLHAFARTALQFAGVRFLLGATEPANFPAGLKTVAEWFPMRERALAAGISNCGTAVGAALAAPIVSAIALHWGWRSAFVIGGGAGFIWVIAWRMFYRSPRDHRWLKPAERLMIEGDSPRPTEQHKPVAFSRLLRLRPVWGCILARALLDPVSYFFIFWTPKYLQQERGLSLAEIGKYGGIPFVAWSVGYVVGGAIPTWLMGLGWSLDRSRKLVMLACSCGVPACCLALTHLSGLGWAIGAISVALFCHGAWGYVTLPAEVFPSHMVGIVTGIGGACGALIGAISQQAIGWTVQELSFSPVFAVCAFLHLTGFALVGRLIGPLGQVQNDGPTP